MFTIQFLLFSGDNVVMFNPYAPPSANDSMKGESAWFRLAGFALITFGLAMFVVAITLHHPIPMGLIAIAALAAICPGMAMIAVSLQRNTDSEKRRRTLVWLLIPTAAVGIIGGTVITHHLQLQRAVEQARQQAMRAQEMAQRSAEEASRRVSDRIQ